MQGERRPDCPGLHALRGLRYCDLLSAEVERQAGKAGGETSLRQADYSWESPQHDLAEARRLIFKHGYLRRKEELEDAEEALT
jgi:hypothetical protein